jgi:quinol monooxygenase YgiN
MADGEDSPKSKSARHAGPVCVVARFEALPGADAALEQSLRAFSLDVRRAEAGCTAYAVTRMIGSPSHFAVHARFADWAAFSGHAKTEHMERALPALTAGLAAPVALEIFLEV